MGVKRRLSRETLVFFAHMQIHYTLTEFGFFVIENVSLFVVAIDFTSFLPLEIPFVLLINGFLLLATKNKKSRLPLDSLT